MKNVLVIGSTGQIGSELTMKLRKLLPEGNIVAGVFHLSRKDAQEAISRGLVFVNEAETVKPDRQLAGGEKLVLRGKGKAIYKGVDGISKKGKSYVILEKFV